MRNKLIQWEKEHGYKSNFVAEKVGVSDSAWCKIKQGKQRISLEQAIRLKEAFEIDDIFELLKED